MNPTEDEAFNSALCHYFLWKAELEKALELSLGCNQPKKAPTSTTTATTSTTKDGDKKLPAQVNTNKKSAKYQKLLDTMRELFPNVPPLPPNASFVQPVLLARYSLFPQINQEVCFLRAQVLQLSQQVLYQQQLPMKKPAPVAAPVLIGNTAPKKAQVTSSTNSNKRKDPPAVTVGNDKETPKEKEKATPKRKRKSTDTTSSWKSSSWKSFDERIKQLEYFVSGNGHCRVPSKDEPGLASWIGQVRMQYRSLEEKSPEERTRLLNRPGTSATRLTTERIAQLDALGFEWHPSRNTVPWETRYQQLLEFKKEKGHANVPKRYKPNPRLGEWLHMQRRLYKRKSEVLMKEGRLEKLEAIGIDWVLGEAKPLWEDRLEECRSFRRANGHLKIPPPPTDEDDDDDETTTSQQLSKEESSLRHWAERLRQEYRRFHAGGKTRTLDRKKIKTLDEMGFDWTIQKKEAAREKEEKVLVI